MKRIYVLLFCASITVACSTSAVPEMEETRSTDVSRESYLLYGTMYGQTRTAFEPLAGGGFRMLWSSGDEIGIFSYDLKETGNINVKATLKSSCAGCAAGEFVPEKIIYPRQGGDITGGVAMPTVQNETFLIYYPYREKTDIDLDDHGIHSTLENVQTQAAISDRKVGQNGFSYAYATVEAGEKKIDFTLRPAMAYLRFVVNSTEFDAYRLQSVYVTDANGSVPMSGDFVFDTDEREIRPVDGSTHTCAKVLCTPDFTKQAAGSELYLTVFSGDYSDADLYAHFRFVNQTGGVATVPVKLDNPGMLRSGVIKTYSYDNLGRSTCPAWYEPLDDRDFLDGRAYGAQNTVCVRAGSSVTFDIKARGNLVGAAEPKYYGIMLPGNIKNQNLLSIGGVKTYEPSPTRQIPSDYKITVNCLSGTSSSFGVVAIYDKDHNILWSYMIWKYENGDPIQDVTYQGIDYVFMDRALGAGKGIAAAVSSGAAGEGAAYFNWGRKDPFVWKAQAPTHYTAELGTGKDLQYAIAHPNVKLGKTNNVGLWYENQRKDLWGAENTGKNISREIVGHKTIYDPCPAGYRVPDYDALKCVDENRKLAEIEFASSDKRYALQHNGQVNHLEVTCPFSDLSALAIMKTDGTYDYWLYHGLIWADGNLSGCTDAVKTGYCYWSNTNSSASGYKAAIIRGWYNGGGTSWFFNTDDEMSGAYPVRCQKIN